MRFIKLTDTDNDSCLVATDSIEQILTDDDESLIIFKQNGETLSVKETIEEILELINDKG